MFHIAICDDEGYFLLREQSLIKKYMDRMGYSYQTSIFHSGKDILDMGNSISKFDIIFLDINMEEIDGIETAKRIRKITKDTYIVFVTAFVTYALEGYKVDAVRYLLKDDECLENAVNECLEAIVNKMNYSERKHIFEFQEGTIELRLENILYVESNLHKLTFHIIGLKAEQYSMYERLDVIDEALHSAGFCRIHKSFLINLRYVESIERYKAEFSNGVVLGISKARYLHAKEAFICYRGEI